ncbi:MAG: glycosyltransferase family 2 protein, partial [Candidatus Magasanikbacteria bacterium]|nr:glycosyltransferase family 2 protein [Candidatus Magasanikbacteria bacterium]
MQSLISIIIPVFNQARELRLALDSIAKQTYKNLEVIVVDDGSVSGLRTTDYGLRHDIRIHFVRQENKGAPAARNRGLEMAK